MGTEYKLRPSLALSYNANLTTEILTRSVMPKDIWCS